MQKYFSKTGPDGLESLKTRVTDPLIIKKILYKSTRNTIKTFNFNMKKVKKINLGFN